MTLVALAKTWNVDPNNIGGLDVANLADHQRTLFAIKEALVGGGSAELTNPMTVVRSSDGVTADATDRWVDFADLIWGAVNHSWIVLQMGAGGAQILWDLNNANARLMTPVWSPAAGFTGGTISARPTATDEQPINATLTTVGWLGQNTGTARYISHVWGSIDGESYRVATFHTTKSCASFMMFEKVRNPVVAGQAPVWNGYVMQMTYPTSTTGHCLRTNGANGPFDEARTRVEYDGSAFGARLTSEAHGTSAQAADYLVGGQAGGDVDLPNEMADAYDLTPVGVFSADAGLRGRLGQLSDVWLGATEPGSPDLEGRGDGDFYPEADDADGARQVVQVGFLVLPWKLSVDMRLNNVAP